MRSSHRGDREFAPKDSGHAATNILFPVNVPFEGNPVIPALIQISQDVSAVIRGFGGLMGKEF